MRRLRSSGHTAPLFFSMLLKSWLLKKGTLPFFDPFGARFIVDGQDISARLIEKSLAVPYDGGTKINEGCE